jgi:hypothetical protein
LDSVYVANFSILSSGNTSILPSLYAFISGHLNNVVWLISDVSGNIAAQGQNKSIEHSIDH